MKTKLIAKKIEFRKYAMFIALVVIAILFQITTKGVLLVPMNVSKLIMQNSYILILAIGMLPCILTGDIDLSVGSILAIVGAVTATMIINNSFSVGLTIVVGLLIGLAIGFWHGIWIAYVKVPAFIVTLAGMLIFRGLTTLILDGNTIAPFPESYAFIAQAFIPDIPGTEKSHLSTILAGAVLTLLYAWFQLNNRRKENKLGIPNDTVPLFAGKMVLVAACIMVSSLWLARYKGLPVILVLLAVLIVLYSFITQKMVIGRHVYALGGNEKAANLSGIKTNFVKFLVYLNMGFIAAIAGIVFSARLGSAAPSAGNGFELDAIAACYVGGASASGGIGTITGAVVGGLVMGVLNNGMSIMGLGTDYQMIAKGLVLLVAVAFDVVSRRKSV